MIDSVYRKDKKYYPKVFLEKYNFNDDIEIYPDDSCNVDSGKEYFDDSDDSDKKMSVKKIQAKKIQMKKIKCINLFLEKTSDLISSHPKM